MAFIDLIDRKEQNELLGKAKAGDSVFVCVMDGAYSEAFLYHIDNVTEKHIFVNGRKYNRKGKFVAGHKMRGETLILYAATERMRRWFYDGL